MTDEKESLSTEEFFEQLRTDPKFVEAPISGRGYIVGGQRPPPPKKEEEKDGTR